MSEDTIDLLTSDLDVDSTIDTIDLCTDGNMWVARVKKGIFLTGDGKKRDIGDGERIPSECVFTGSVRALNTARRWIESQELSEDDTEDTNSGNTSGNNQEDGSDRELEEQNEQKKFETVFGTDSTVEANQLESDMGMSVEQDSDSDENMEEQSNDQPEEPTKHKSEIKSEPNDSSLLENIRSFVSPNISDADQDTPEAQNVSIDFINRESDEEFWSEEMNKFWDKLRMAKKGNTQVVEDIRTDLWDRYKTLILHNKYARGDAVDTIFGSFLFFLGAIIFFMTAVTFATGSTGIYNLLTVESGYADHIFLTTGLLFIVGVSFWLSRRVNGETLVSAIQTPARMLEITVVAAQVLVAGTAGYILIFGGGENALARLEISFTDGLISVLSILPASEILTSAIEAYRGPQSITGLSLVESSLLMMVVGFIIGYPVAKRSVARFVLTVNQGPRAFEGREDMIEDQTSDEESQPTDNKEYDIKEKEEERIRREAGKNVETEDDLIALPYEIKDSRYPEYEEVNRYWVKAPYAYVSIQRNERQNDHRYVVVEPELDTTERVLFDEIKTRLDNVLLFEDVEEYEEEEKERKEKLEKLEKRVIELTQDYEIDINDESFHKLMYYIERDYVYYNKIDPLMNDPNVEDISCDGDDSYIFVFHEDHKDIMTNIKFQKEELRSFIQELAQRSGEHISQADPMVDASLPDGSRAQMTLGSEVTTKGSTFTIRLFEDIPFTPVDLLDFETFSLTQMAYLWTAIEHKKSLIFAGGTASGKTTSMNAVSMFIPPKSKVITIEDTREISLPQENWIAGTTREGSGGDDSEGSEDIDMYQLLRAALRQRPEYIVVGEIRGREAETLFQAMNTGHTTYSTMHAETVKAAIGRLTNPPINVPKQMITALDIICIQNQIRFTDDDGNQLNVRRNEETREIVGLRDNGSFNNRRPFQWDAETDTFIQSIEDSYVLDRVANENGWTAEEKREELRQRKEILEYMLENDITEFEYVTNVIQSYMVDSEKVVNRVRNDNLDPESLSSLTDVDVQDPEDDPEETLNEEITEAPEMEGDER